MGLSGNMVGCSKDGVTRSSVKLPLEGAYLCAFHLPSSTTQV